MKKPTFFLLAVLLLGSLSSCDVEEYMFTKSFVTSYDYVEGIGFESAEPEGPYITLVAQCDYTKSIDSEHGSGSYESRCQYYGDTSYDQRISTFLIDQKVDAFYQHFERIDVVCQEEYDAQHPAGTSLNDIVMFFSLTPSPFIESGYCELFRDFDSLPTISGYPLRQWANEYAKGYNNREKEYMELYRNHEDIPSQWFPVYEKLSVLTAEDLKLVKIAGGYDRNLLGILHFISAPSTDGPKTFTVTMTTVDGEVFTHTETVSLKFDR